jgi:hypothetical protein
MKHPADRRRPRDQALAGHMRMFHKFTPQLTTATLEPPQQVSPESFFASIGEAVASRSTVAVGSIGQSRTERRCCDCLRRR